MNPQAADSSREILFPAPGLQKGFYLDVIKGMQ